MTRKAKASNPLAARLDARMAELSASDDEVGAIIGRDPKTVREWRQGKADIDAESQVLLRPFVAADPSAAERALERVQTKQTRDMRGEDWQTADVAVPYGGGYAGTDAGAPK